MRNSQNHGHESSDSPDVSRRAFLKLGVRTGVGVTAALYGGPLLAASKKTEIIEKIRNYPWYTSFYRRMEQEAINEGGSEHDLFVKINTKLVVFFIKENTISGTPLTVLKGGYKDTESHDEALLKVLDTPEADTLLQSTDDNTILQETPFLEVVSNSISEFYEKNKLALLGTAGVVGTGATIYVLRNRIKAGLSSIAKNRAVKQTEKDYEYLRKNIASGLGLPGDISSDDLLDKVYEIYTENEELHDELEQVAQSINTNSTGNTSSPSGGNTSGGNTNGNTQQQSTAETALDTIKELKDQLIQGSENLAVAIRDKEEAERRLEAYDQQIGMVEGGADFIDEFMDFATKGTAILEGLNKKGSIFGKGIIITQEHCSTLYKEVKNFLREIGGTLNEDEQNMWLPIPIEELDEGKELLDANKIKEAHTSILSAYAMLQYIQKLQAQMGGGGEGSENMGEDIEAYQENFKDIVIPSEDIAEYLGVAWKGEGYIVDIYELFSIDANTDFSEMEDLCKSTYRKLVKKFHPDGKNIEGDEKEKLDICFKIINSCKDDVYTNDSGFKMYRQGLPLFYPDKYGQ